MTNVEQIKQKILWILDEKGPGLPVQIARATSLSPIFASAILSELKNENKIRLSNMKIGSSPLYFIPGQEQKLENFSDDLKGVEKSAFLKLKQNKILEDEKQEPAVRVALRMIKDFAVQLKFHEKIIWKYAFVSSQEITPILDRLSSGIEKKPWKEKQEQIEKPRERPLLETKQKKQREARNQKSEEFLEEVKKYLIEKDIKFLNEVQVDKKKIIAQVRINSDLGEIIFLLIARDKKRITEADLTMAYQKALNKKMPCLFLSRGKPSKRTHEFLENHENLLRVMKLE